MALNEQCKFKVTFSEKVEFNSKLKAELSEANAEINKRGEQIVEQQNEINAKQVEIEAQQNEIASQQQEINAKQAEIEAKQTEIEAKQNILDDLVSGELETFENNRVNYLKESALSYQPYLTYAGAAACETVGTNCFKADEALLDVYLPLAKIIKDDAFKSCISLPIVNLPSLEKCGNSCFQESTSLTKVVAPNMIQIGANAFRNCSALTVANYPEARVGNYAFSHCTNLKEIIISGQFGGVPSLTTGGGADTDTGALAFEYCTSLESLTLAYLTYIETTVFTNVLSSLDRTSLKKISMPRVNQTPDDSIYYFFGNDESTIRDAAPTANFKNIEEIYFPEVTRRIPYRLFWKNTSLKKMTVGTINNIQGEAFYDSSIEEFYGKADTIGDGAFRGCTSLRRFNSEQDGVCIIGGNQINASAFQGCNNITKFAVGYDVYGGHFTRLININAIPSGAFIYIPYYQRDEYYNDSVWSQLSDRMITYMDISEVYTY